MAGIYIHIPFCKKACTYCDFHFSTQTNLMDEMISALIKEIETRKNYLANETIESIYFGGGTPSLISKKDILNILDCIYKNYTVSEKIECTLEANPDDINNNKTIDWKEAGINRLSIGIQSFFDEDLLWMGRAHDSQQAKKSVDIALQNGISKISADLIYGFNLLSLKKWEYNIDTLLSTGINHLSAYSLTIEEKTALDFLIKKGVEKTPSNELAIEHYKMLQEKINSYKGWQQYEISNYCKDENYALHNSNYWKQKKYLGIGPSAHSYNLSERQFNIRNNTIYIKNISENSDAYEVEKLSTENKFNEYIMIGLRTKWGIDLDFILNEFGKEVSEDLSSKINILDKKYYCKNGQKITLTNEGKLLADHICMNLFI